MKSVTAVFTRGLSTVRYSNARKKSNGSAATAVTYTGGRTHPRPVLYASIRRPSSRKRSRTIDGAVGTLSKTHRRIPADAFCFTGFMPGAVSDAEQQFDDGDEQGGHEAHDADGQAADGSFDGAQLHG